MTEAKLKTVTPDSKGKTAFEWSNYLDRSRVLQNLKDTKSFTDVALVSEDGRIEAVHSCVLSPLSSRLYDYVREKMEDPETARWQNSSNPDHETAKVLIPGLSGEVLKVIVECAYTGYISSTSDGIWDILKAAEEYQMRDVIQACCTYLIYQMNTKNCVDLLHLGHKYQHKLRTSAWNMLKLDFVKILRQGDAFGKLSLNYLESLLDDDELNIEREDMVWEAIKRWTADDVDERRRHVHRLLKTLRHGRVNQCFLVDDLAADPLVKHDVHTEKLVQTMIKQNKEEHEKQKLDGYGLPVGFSPKHIRPRVPSQILFAIGGWQEGIPTTLMETFDVRTIKWFESKMSHQHPRAYHGMEIIDGIIYLVGGTDGNEILNSLHCYDPVTGRWFQRANMYEQRCYVSTAVLDGKLIAMGGHNGTQRVKTVEMFDPETNQWSKLADMNLARSDACATVLHDKIYIAGGLNDQVIENSVESYDPVEKVWTFLHPMSSPRTSLALVAYHNSLYAIGGNNGFERLSSMERYDFGERLWLPAATMKSRRSTFAACVLEDRLYAVGGYNGHTPINQVERFDDISNEWTVIKNLRHDRSGLAVCVLKGIYNSKDFTFLGSSPKSILNNSYTRNARNLFRSRHHPESSSMASGSELNRQASRDS